MKIVHFSDWHGELYKLPEADLYICTGDMLSNYPHDDYSHEKEECFQLRHFDKKYKYKNKTMREWFGSPDAPIVVVRGNHDYIPLAPFFGGDVVEIDSPHRSHNILGLEIGGFRGINYIAGDWSDEYDPTKFYETMRSLPNNLDIIVSHSPPLNILDGKFGERYGIQAYASWITDKLYVESDLPKLFCFGHVHNDIGVEEIGGSIFSNAATGHNIIEL